MAPRLKSVQYEQVQKRFLAVGSKHRWFAPDFDAATFKAPAAPQNESWREGGNENQDEDHDQEHNATFGSFHGGNKEEDDDGDDYENEDDALGEDDGTSDSLPPFYKEANKKIGDKFEGKEEEDEEREEFVPTRTRRNQVITDDSEGEDNEVENADDSEKDPESDTNLLALEVSRADLEDKEPLTPPTQQDGFVDWEISICDDDNYLGDEPSDPADRTYDLTEASPPTHVNANPDPDSESFDDLDDYYSHSAHSLPFSDEIVDPSSPLKLPFSEELPPSTIPPATKKEPARVEKENIPVQPSNIQSQTPKATAKPTAKSTKQFKEDREMFAYHLYHEYNRVIFEGKLPDNMKITWSVNLKTTAGRSVLRKKIQNDTVLRESEIELSTKVLDSLERLRQTLAHEMCHVAAFLINHIESPPHGPAFKYWGARVEQKYPELHVTTCHNYEINFKFNFLCTAPGCGKVYGRHSNSVDLETARCVCGGRLKREEKLKKDGTPHKPRAPNAWQEYIKENLGKVKALHPQASHSTVMTILKERYQETKNAGGTPPQPIVIEDD